MYRPDCHLIVPTLLTLGIHNALLNSKLLCMIILILFPCTGKLFTQLQQYCSVWPPVLLEKRPFSRGNKRTLVCLAEGQVTRCCWTRSLCPAASAESLISVQTGKCSTKCLLLKRCCFCHRGRGKLCRTAAEPPGCCDRQSWEGFHYCSWQDTIASSVNVLQRLATELQYCCWRLEQVCSHHLQQGSDVCSGPVCIVAFCAHTHSRGSSRHGH